MDSKISLAVNKMIKVNKKHKQTIDCAVAQIGIHRTQHRILMHLSHRGELPSQKELAALIGVTPAAVTGALKKLEIDGYITKTAGADSRFNVITITDLGREVVTKTRALFFDVDSKMLRNFSESDLETYISLLDRMEKNLSEDV